MTTNNEAFKAYLNKFKHVTGGLRVYSELNEHEKSIAKDAWQAATTEANKRIEAIEALSVTKIMVKVVPGFDGMGEEVFAKSVGEVEQIITDAYVRIEELESEVAELKHDRNEWYKDAQDKRLRILELKAHINHLREAFNDHHLAIKQRALTVDIEQKLINLLKATPAESLQAHDGEVSQCKIDAERYQFVRKLNPREFAEIYDINIKTGVHFDHLISQALKEVK